MKVIKFRKKLALEHTTGNDKARHQFSICLMIILSVRHVTKLPELEILKILALKSSKVELHATSIFSEVLMKQFNSLHLQLNRGDGTRTVCKKLFQIT